MRTLPLIFPALVVAGFCAVTTAQITGPIPLAWRWAGSTATSPVGTPLVDGDNVYVGVGSRVYCLDRTTGNKKWQYPLIDPIDGTFQSTMVMLDGTLYAPASNKTLYAIDPAKGDVKWSYVAPGGIVGRPVIAGKQIVLNVDANSLMAVNSADGTAAFANPERVFDGIKGDIFSFNTDVYYFTSRLDLYFTNVSTRRATQVVRFQSLPSSPTPVVFGSDMYVTTGNVLMSLTPGGTRRWQRNLQDSLMFGPAVSTEGVVAVTESGIAHILDSTGSIREMKVGNKNVPMQINLGSRPIAPPAAVGKLFAIPTANGALTLIDPQTGLLVWSYTIKPLTAGLKNAGSSNQNNPGGSGISSGDMVISVPAAGPAVAAGNTLLILASDGSLLAFDNEYGVDLTGPSVTSIWPQAGLQVGTVKGPLDLYFQVTDEATGVNDKTLKVTVNGNPVEFTFGRDGVLALRFAQGGKNAPIANGRAVFEISVSDWMGNQTVSKLNFTIDNDLAPLPRPGGAPGTGPGAGPGGGLGGGTRGGGVGGGR